MNSNLSYSPETPNSGQNWPIFVPCDLEIRLMILKNNSAPLLYYPQLCALFQSHRWIQTWVTIRKRSIGVKIYVFFFLCDLEFWQMTLKNNRVPLLCCFKLCASFHSRQWIPNRVTVRKHPIWRMTLKNINAPLLSNIKLCARFNHHM